MDMYFAAVFTDAYIGTICTGFAVGDVMGSLHLYSRRRILLHIRREKVVENILYRWLIHGSHLLPIQNQTDC